MKMSTNPLVVILMLTSTLLIQCNKQTINDKLISYFPNKVGDTWMYAATDSVTSTPNNPFPSIHYLVNIAVIGVKNMVDGLPASVWKITRLNYLGQNYTDTNYVRLTGDTIKVFDEVYSKTIENLKFPRRIILLPFEINKKWSGKLQWVDSSLIVTQMDTTINNKIYNGAFKIHYIYVGPNLNNNDYFIFEPKIGLISSTRTDFNGAELIYTTWNLRSYQLN